MWNRGWFLLVALLAFTSMSAGATVVTFSDDEFALPPWSSMTINGAAGGQVSVQDMTGGNPGSFLSVSTVTSASTFTSHTNAGFVYDPAQGAITSIDISLDYRNITAFGEGHGVSTVLAVQDGNVFAAGNFITGSSDFSWRTASETGLTAADFSLSAGSGALDFNGAPITFGFETRNESGNSINVGYDNYNLSLHTVPIPAGLPLLACAIAVLAWVRKH